MNAMINTSFLNQLDRFSLIINKRVTSNYVGERKSVYTGRGTTFKDHRIYAPGDDIRLVDWRVYARTDDLYVKRYEEERNLSVHIIMDTSASMNFGTPTTKYEYAAMLGLGFAYLAMKSNEKFQFASFSQKLDMFKPKKGMRQLAAMLSYLNTARPQGATNFYDALLQYRKIINTRSFIVIISDFLFDLQTIESALYLLGANHQIKLVQVLDRVERDMRLEGDLRLKDAESGGLLRTFVSQRLRSGYLNMLDSHNMKINEMCSKLGIEFYTVTTDTPLFDVFFDMLKG